MIDRAISDYRTRCETARLDQYPLLWVGHYNSTELLGSYGSHDYPPEMVGDLVVTLMAPFGICAEVQQSWLVIDGSHIRPFQRLLFISGLTAVGRGIGTVHYVAGYRIEDWGKTRIDTPRKAFYRAPAVHKALSVLMDRRMEPASVGWDEAYLASLEEIGKVI